MTCAQFDEILQDLNLPGAVPIELGESAVAHAEECSRCGALLQETESLELALRALAQEDAPRQANGGMEQRLLLELRRVRGRTTRAWAWRTAAALGTAAAVFLVVMAVAWHVALRGNGNTHTPGGTTEPATSPAGTSPGPAAAPEPSQQRDWTDIEEASGFVPLPFVNPDAAAEDGAIVRVILTRPVLDSLGLPIVDDDEAEPILADLLLAEDGTPLAIRLETESNPARSAGKIPGIRQGENR